ncbi:c-di-GMP-binding flagellar brake protein YcgR, contains PilZNR and PilZ domains [Clostridium gasigenes]|uniref:C-di-GMP-binding flagellar brake protein YcgR, contains PilZNR and PilZ domains n=1 Tax=Clostridium gasigenes TaxID=94869 RepID=A0A1H0TU93_9CLOT|nr:c-di-GMP-binding flagellar brake protein YcgR, contains PilZNR and PilZ domains [Clostridium gasigenes]
MKGYLKDFLIYFHRGVIVKKFDVVINSKLEVKWADGIYKTLVQDSNSKNILISIPVVGGVYLTLKTGEEIELVYYDNGENIFSFKCRVINRIKENNISYYSITLPYDVIKIQRRNYVRVDTVQVIKDIKKYEKETNGQADDKISNALLLDLSGGGMRIKLREKLEKSDVISAKIGSENEEVLIKGKIVRVDITEDKRYIYGISFEELDNRTRERIIQIVFRIMREQRKLR